MLANKNLLSGAMRLAAVTRPSQARAFSASSFYSQEQTEKDSAPEGKKTPYRTARYLRELEEKQASGPRSFGRGRPEGNADNTQRNASGESNKGRFGERRPRFNKSRSSNPRFNSAPAPRFEAPPTIPYDITKELQFADKVDWAITSVLESRPLYGNVASGKGAVAPLGTAAVNSSHAAGFSQSSDIYSINMPGTAFSAETVGVRADGDFDPEVEQSLIQELGALQSNKDKDHRKASDVSVDNQKLAFHMTHNYQEIMNPRNVINRFNNGNVKHMAGTKYEIGSDEVASAGKDQAEKSWKRLERLGGDYTRASNPLSLLTNKPKTGKSGSALLESISPLIGQNQSIGLEDKKKLMKALEKGLGAY
ncbi:hypothetical protein BG005_001340 [Podila minutissima]|nr:hypothetical protein BG005_001340 [Podila minutissima]